MRRPRRPVGLAVANEDARALIRRPVQLEATISSTHAGREIVRIGDITALGCRIDSVRAMVTGSYVVISFPSLTPIGATVRWAGSGSVGVSFVSALHPTTVDRFVQLSKAG